MANVKVPKLLHKMSLASQKAWYKKQGMEMPSAKKPAEDEGKSAAAAKKVKVAPRKTVAVKAGSIRALNAARQQAYMAKGGRQPIGATGSGGSNVMAGSNMSTAKGMIAGIKAGFNPKVSLNPYEGLTAKEKKAMKSEEVEQVDEGSKRMSAAVKLQRAFDREKAASDASRKRGEEVLAQARAEYAKKQAAKTNEEAEQVDEGSKAETEKVQVSKTEAEKVLGGPVSKRPKMPPGKQPAGYRYVRGLARRAMKASMKKEEVEQTDEAKKPDASVVMTNQLRNKMISDKDKRTLGKVANLMAAQKKKVKEEVEQVDEKINLVKAKMGDVITDFQKSDAPQFRGKSRAKRRQMALAAKLGAEREAGMREEVEQVDEFVDRETRLAARKAETGSSTRVSSGDVLGRRGGHETPKRAIARRVGKDSYGIKSGGKTSIYNRLPKPNLPEEAEGKTPKTDTEVSLAKMHGNPKKITYGDVVKARIASAKKKILNKGE